jgi:autotransporter-associated beta strand protein
LNTSGAVAIPGAGAQLIGTPDVLVNGGTLKWLQNSQLGANATVSETSGNVNLNNQNQTLYAFQNSGGTFVTGTGTLTGTGATVTWSGGTNTVNASGTVTDGHVAISGGTNTVQGQGAGTTGGVLQVTGGGIGLEVTGGVLVLNSDAGVAGKLNLLGNVITNTSSTTSQITSGLGNTNPGNINLNGVQRTFTIAQGTSPSGIDLSVSAVLANGGLIKAGAGTMVLAAANTYTGNTNVNLGTLVVNGSLNASSAVTVGTVSTNATLAGKGGTVNGPVTVLSGSTIAVSNAAETSGATAGTLTLGSTTLNHGSTYQWGLANAIGIAGTDWDLLRLSGLTVGGSGDVTIKAVVISSAPQTPVDGTIWDVINTGDNTGTTAAAAIAANMFVLDTSTLHFASDVNATSFSVVQDPNNLGDIAIQVSAAPEPTSMMLLGLGVGGLAMRRRRRKLVDAK